MLEIPNICTYTYIFIHIKLYVFNDGGRSKGTCLVENKQGKIQNNKNTMQNKENKLLENMHTEKQRNFQLDPPSFRHNHIHCLFFNTAKGAVVSTNTQCVEQLIPHNVWSQLTHT